MNIYDPKNKKWIQAIRFCLNAKDDIKLLNVKYSEEKDIYKCRVIDYTFGGRVTIRLEGKFVRSSYKWIEKGKKAIWPDTLK